MGEVTKPITTEQADILWEAGVEFLYTNDLWEYPRLWNPRWRRPTASKDYGWKETFYVLVEE